MKKLILSLALVGLVSGVSLVKANQVAANKATTEESKDKSAAAVDEDDEEEEDDAE